MAAIACPVAGDPHPISGLQLELVGLVDECLLHLLAFHLADMVDVYEGTQLLHLTLNSITDEISAATCLHSLALTSAPMRLE